MAATGRLHLTRPMLQVEVKRVYVGTFMTSLDMSGISLSVCVLDDERILALDADTQVCASSKYLCLHRRFIWESSMAVVTH